MHSHVSNDVVKIVETTYTIQHIPSDRNTYIHTSCRVLSAFTPLELWRAAWFLIKDFNILSWEQGELHLTILLLHEGSRENVSCFPSTHVLNSVGDLMMHERYSNDSLFIFECLSVTLLGVFLLVIDYKQRQESRTKSAGLGLGPASFMCLLYTYIEDKCLFHLLNRHTLHRDTFSRVSLTAKVPPTVVPLTVPKQAPSISPSHPIIPTIVIITAITIPTTAITISPRTSTSTPTKAPMLPSIIVILEQNKYP